MGIRLAEQVIVVLATGSGKSLVPMVSASIEGAGVTILVLPMVALRTNMLERLRVIGIRALV